MVVADTIESIASLVNDADADPLVIGHSDGIADPAYRPALAEEAGSVLFCLRPRFFSPAQTW